MGHGIFIHTQAKNAGDPIHFADSIAKWVGDHEIYAFSSALTVSRTFAPTSVVEST
jgi:hypothetical protein